MVDVRRSWAPIALLALAVIGIGVSVYLTAVHYQSAPLVCSSTGLIDCARVLSSAYSVVPGTQIPITIPGMGWFVIAGALAALAAFRGQERRDLRLATLAWASLGMLTVFYLVYTELVSLHTICIWCTSVHIIIFVMFLIAVTQLLQMQEQDEEDLSDEEEEEATAVNTARD